MKIKTSIVVILSIVFYTWSLLPFFCAEYTEGILKIFFNSLLIMAVCISIIKRKKLNIDYLKMLIIITFVIFSFFIMNFFDYKESSKYFNVVLFFWITFLLNIFMNSSEKNILVKWIIVIMCVTTLTSSIGVLINNDAARTIAHAISDRVLQIEISKKNIAGIYLFQGLVCVSPSIITLLVYKKKKIYAIFYSLIMTFILANASFSISLIIFLMLFIVDLIIKSFRDVKYAKSTIRLLIGLIIIIIFVFFGEKIILWLSSVIGIEKVSERLAEVSKILFNGSNFIKSGDVSERFALYKVSLDTFLNNIFTGIGPYYSFIKFQNGIGFHSQTLDDMARYGISAILFYICFFRTYYKILKKNWSMIGDYTVAHTTTIAYFIFLLLNIGFRSHFESTMMILIIPNLPKIFKNTVVRKDKDENNRETSLCEN